MSKLEGYDDLSHGQTKAFVQKAGGVRVLHDVLRDEAEMIPVPVISRLTHKHQFKFGDGWIPSFDRLLQRSDIFTEKEQDFGEMFAYQESFEGITEVSAYVLKSFFGSTYGLSKALPMKYFFSASIGFQVIVSMLVRQPEGLDGDLTVERGACNTFYVLNRNYEPVVVCVHWGEHRQKWEIRYYPMDVTLNHKSLIFVNV